MQIIFHIDLNAFFASAEVSRHPELKGKPLVISGNSRRSIVSTASYEARKYGIHSAMPLFKAKELCPNLITVSPHFDLYKSLSNDFFEIISTFSPLLEVASIDECYVDMTEYIRITKQHPYDVACQIQQKIKKEVGLQCSIGIAPNKFLAKMASDMKKPMGITVITNSNYKEKIWPLPIGEMFGIGKKTAPRLIEIGIHTIGDLAKYENYEKIKPIFGKNALTYYHKANGKDFSKINFSHNERKSIGKSTTFERDSHDEVFIKNKLKALSQDIAMQAQKRNLVSNSISITLKYSREKSRSKQTIIDTYRNDFQTIYATALLLFDSIYQGEMIRLVGVSINNVVSKKDLNEQISLFDSSYIDSHPTQQTKQIDDVLSQLNSHLPQAQFVKASDLLKQKEDEAIQKKYLKNSE